MLHLDPKASLVTVLLKLCTCPQQIGHLKRLTHLAASRHHFYQSGEQRLAKGLQRSTGPCDDATAADRKNVRHGLLQHVFGHMLKTLVFRKWWTGRFINFFIDYRLLANSENKHQTTAWGVGGTSNGWILTQSLKFFNSRARANMELKVTPSKCSLARRQRAKRWSAVARLMPFMDFRCMSTTSRILEASFCPRAGRVQRKIWGLEPSTRMRFPTDGPSTCHPTIPPSHHPTIPPSHHPTIPPSHHPTIPPSHHPTIPPSHHPTIPPSHIPRPASQSFLLINFWRLLFFALHSSDSTGSSLLSPAMWRMSTGTLQFRAICPGGTGTNATQGAKCRGALAASNSKFFVSLTIKMTFLCIIQFLIF